MLKPQQWFLEYTDKNTREDRRGNEVPANNRDFYMCGTPQHDELVRFIAQHLTYTHRTLVLRGHGRPLAYVVGKAASRLMPWQFKMAYQHADGSQSWEAHFACVGSWIDAGKYKEFL